MLSKEKYSAIMNLLRRISQISHLKTGNNKFYYHKLGYACVILFCSNIK